ncbi:MAG: hypothetical protein OEL57_03475 [Trichlorobacter sp.]|uniref:hypothetical protein n=1 Tax=Trichlorobacter sp. TaxID=2911007 RepID=UPI002563DCC0|nr:hypothetical protein [Trichlorobacter sp.]MDK9716953.1 hypothetical protein [Trichlorobacter sp.]
MGNNDTSYYLTTTLKALEAAYRVNQDLVVATHLSQAMDALHRMAHQSDKSARSSHQTANDPYEMDEYNSAV